MLFDPAAFWTVFGTYEGDPIRFDPWQMWHLRDYTRYRAREKAPQIGFSWLSALEAVWESLLFLDATTSFVSVDQREANEKILYAKKAFTELPEMFREWVPLVKDSVEELWLGDSARPSRVLSIPATSALRGRRMSVVIDEADFYKDGGKDTFRVATGRVLRGGRVTIGSTCFGVDTQLDHVMSGDERNFSRARFPYTVAENPEVQAAIAIARDELDPADFDEEYDCIRGAVSGFTFPPELLRDNQHDDVLFAIDDEFTSRARLIAGYDVGASQHPSVLSVFQRFSEWRQISITEKRGERLTVQERFLAGLLRRCPNLTLVVDAQGIGMQAAQTLEDSFSRRVISMHPGIVNPDKLPSMDRAEMTTQAQRRLQTGEVRLGADREQAQQFRRTRLVKVPGGRTKVDQPGSAKRTHYDRYWSSVYGIYGIGASERGGRAYESHGLRVLNFGRNRKGTFA